MDGSQGGQRVGFDPLVAGVAGHFHGGLGAFQGLGEAAGVAVNLGEGTQDVGLGAPVSDLADQAQGLSEVTVSLVQPPERVDGLAKVGKANGFVAARSGHPGRA